MIWKADAQQKYVDVVNGLIAKDRKATGGKDSGGPSTKSAGSEDVKVTTKDNVNVITLNRPTKKNALLLEVSQIYVFFVHAVSTVNGTNVGVCTFIACL